MIVYYLVKRYPLVEELGTSLAAPQCFELFKDRPFCFFLDSGMAPDKLGRYSFMGSDPFLMLRSRGSEVTLSYGHGGQQRIHPEQCRRIEGDPFDVVNGLLERYSLETHPDTPLAGGAVGYFSYDLCHFIEHLPSTAADDLNLPECYLAFYDAVVTFDHLTGKTYLVAAGFPELDEDARKRQAKKKLGEMRDRLARGLPDPGLTPAAAARPALALKSNFTREEYLQAVATAREYILAGDIFQVNLSQRFEADLPVSPYELYRRLRRVNPAPFAAYLDFEGVSVACASPERFLQTRGDRVQTRPIKGTRPRGKSAAEDEALARQLLASVKDRAENVMIVDLERNDLGRVCRYGTVNVTELAILETYPTVFHLTSTIEGRLRRDKNRIDLLRAAFPGGSITGAPKVRAMEIIDELEPTRRSIYTGALGYLSFSDQMDLNIAIRTFIIKEGKAYFQVGGGIVYDSEPEAEYRETLDKAKALLQALNPAAQVAVEASQ
ncbi:MAG: aminodeoxychorismate synthase component I [Chloroflexi bacterium]|nr:aminodeoxychorismate synthase component I [Chloroflexota bacterium]